MDDNLLVGLYGGMLSLLLGVSMAVEEKVKGMISLVNRLIGIALVIGAFYLFTLFFTGFMDSGFWIVIMAYLTECVIACAVVIGFRK